MAPASVRASNQLDVEEEGNNTSSLNIEQGQEKATQNDDFAIASAHTIDHGITTISIHLC